MSKHSRRETRRRYEAFTGFVEANPPRMPESFTNRDYKRVEGYAYAAFVTGWNAAMNDLKKSILEMDGEASA